MSETWLRINRRPLWLGLIVPILMFVVGALLVAGILGSPDATWLRVAGAVLTIVSLLVLAGIVRRLITPLLAYSPGSLLVHLRTGDAIRVPIEIVEGFLLGRDEVKLDRGRRAETNAVVVRFAEKAEEWAKVDISRHFGHWCGGYLTIRGLWCEPLNVGLINRLNQRLAEVQAAQAKQEAN